MIFICFFFTCFFYWNIFHPMYLCFAQCDKGFFKVGQMTECHSWLTCKDISNLDVGDLIGFGAVKQVYRTTWQNNTVAFVLINNRGHISDFLYGLEMLQGLGPSKYIVQLVGFCLEADVYLTEYHPLGNSMNINEKISDTNSELKKRFELCIDYVRILEFLHNSPLGKLVMCDSNTLNKTLEQYLITTSLNLILNDVDALPEVGHRGIICGHKELRGGFIAPEQNWPHHGENYEEDKMQPYDEKVDIWKIPPVCNYFLGKSEAAKGFRYHVYPIHRQCRVKDPQNRPTATEVLKFYENIFHEYFMNEFMERRKEL